MKRQQTLSTMRTSSLILLSLLSFVMLPNTQAAIPTASDKTITISEDNAYSFSADDFGYLDTDDDHPFTSIQVTTLETAGTLRFFNDNVVLNQEIFVANLTNLTFKPALNTSGNAYDSFQFTVHNDSESSASSNTITFNVQPVDDLPTFITPPLSTIDEDSLYDFTPIIADADIDPIGTLIFSIANQPTWITSFDPDSGQLSGTPENSHVGVHSNIIITVQDTSGLSTSLPPFSITVNNTNDAPSFRAIPTPATSVDEDQYYSFTPIVDDDDDLHTIDTKIYAINNKPTWATFNTATGELSGTPLDEDAGSKTNDIRITVTDLDGLGLNDVLLIGEPLSGFNITVNPLNDAPTFTNSPATSINENDTYSITLTATDVDSIDADLVFSITPGTSLPDWLDFNPDSRLLRSKASRPNNDDVGTYNNISLTVTDNEGKSTSLPPFSITVNNVNNDPAGSISIIGTFEEGEWLTVNTVLLTDEDGLGTFRYLWQRNDLNIGTSKNYQLVNTDVGTSQTIYVTVSYTDRRGTDESVTISASEDEITGNTPVQGSVTINSSHQPYIGQTLIANTETLLDADGLGTFSFKWRRSGTATVIGTNSSQYLLTAADENQTITVTVSYIDEAGYDESVTSDPTAPVTIDPTQDSDGDGMTDIDEIKYGLNPNVNDAEQDLDGDGVTNKDELDAGTDPTKDDYPPADFTVPADKTIHSSGLLTTVDLGIATTVDGKDGVISAIPDNSGPFRPGIHTISWTATDAAGNATTSTTQTINIIPMVDFAIDQISNEGTTATVSVHLNGPITSDLSIPFTLSGTAASDDYDIATNSISITSGNVSGNVSVIVTDADATEVDETLIFTMGDLTALGVITGHKTTHTITITEQNIAPKISLLMTQDDTHTSTVVADADPDPDNVTIIFATVVASVTDSNAITVFDWNASDNTLVDSDGDPTDDTFTFNPSLLNVGTYTIVVKVDDGDLVTTQKHRFKVVVSVPADEDHEDRDDDGIADQYDEIALSHVIALQQADQFRHLVETQPGLQLRLGAIAFESVTNGLQVSAATIETYATSIQSPNDDYFNVGGLFDFEIHGLSQTGDSALVVIPLRTAIPANPHYRKLMRSGWQAFIIDEKNTLASASGSNGSCPPTNSSAYRQGLTPGHLCIQLQLEDGGPNDADGEANGVITDPGGVAVEPLASERPPPQEVLPLPATGGGALYSVLLLLLALAYSRSCRCHRHSPKIHT